MYLPKSLLAVCGTDLTRHAIMYVYVDVEKKHAVATDGSMLVTYPITPVMTPDVSEVSGYVPREAIAHAWKQKGSMQGVLLHFQAYTSVGGTHFPNPHSNPNETAPQYPDYTHLFPPEAPAHVGLNANLLATLARVLAPKTGVVELTLSPGLGPITVCALENRAARALLMPVRCRTAHVPTEDDATSAMQARIDALEAQRTQLETRLREGAARCAALELDRAFYKDLYGELPVLD